MGTTNPHGFCLPLYPGRWISGSGKAGGEDWALRPHHSQALPACPLALPGHRESCREVSVWMTLGFEFSTTTCSEL